MVPPPVYGFWRVTNHHEPFDPPPAPPPIGTAGAEDDEARRYDAPDGSYRTLYCATEPEGALGEKLAHFQPNPQAVAPIQAFLADDPDPDQADDYLASGLHAEDISDERRGFTRRLAGRVRESLVDEEGVFTQQGCVIAADFRHSGSAGPCGSHCPFSHSR
jgi:hypothetical protein